MSTLEATVSIIKSLSEEDLIKIQNYAKAILKEREQSDSRSEQITKQQFLDELEISRQQAEQGQYKNAHSVLSEMRKRYAL